MTPGEIDAAIVRRHLLALDSALQILRKSQGQPVAGLEADPEKLWAVEHGRLDDFAEFARYVKAYLDTQT
jgi:hypothetical protein